MENIIDEAAIRANEDREKLKRLLEMKPAAMRNMVLSMYDQTPSVSEKGADVVALLGMAGIKTRVDLCKALANTGLRQGTTEWDTFYDKYCESHPNLPI